MITGKMKNKQIAYWGIAAILLAGLLAVHTYTFAADKKQNKDKKTDEVIDSTGSLTQQEQKIDVNKEIKDLKDKNITKKMKTIRRLARSKDKQASRELMDEYKREKKNATRVRLMESLADTQDKTLVPEVWAILTSTETSKDVKYASVQTLSELAGDESVETLADIFLNEKESIEVRGAAASELGLYLKDDIAFNALKEGLKNANPSIREQAICSLGTAFGDEMRKIVIPYIEGMLKDKDEKVSKRAAEILEALKPQKRQE